MDRTERLLEQIRHSIVGEDEAIEGPFGRRRRRGRLLRQHSLGAARPETLGPHQGYAPAYDETASDSLLAARRADKVDGAAKAVGDWLGDRARVIANKFGDKVFINEAVARGTGRRGIGRFEPLGWVGRS